MEIRRNTSLKKTEEVAKQLLKIWITDTLKMYEIIWLTNEIYEEFFEQELDQDVFSSDSFLFGTNPAFLLGQIQSENHVLTRQQSLIKIFYINVFSVLDSYMEYFFKGFISYSSPFHFQFLQKGFDDYYNRLKTQSNKTVSENVSRYNYFFDNNDNVTNEDKEVFNNNIDEWYKVFFISGDETIFTKLEPEKDWDFFNDLNEFNGKFRYIRNMMIHQAFTKPDEVLDEKSFVRFMGISTRIVTAMVVKSIQLTTIAKERD